MKAISRRRKRAYTALTVFTGVIGAFVLAVTLFSLGFFKEVGADPTLLLVCSSLTLFLVPFCVWRLKRLKVRENESTK